MPPRDGDIFREPDGTLEVSIDGRLLKVEPPSMDATKMVLESLKDAFPIPVDSDYRGDTVIPRGDRTNVAEDRNGWDIEVGDIVYVGLIGGNYAVYEVAEVTLDGVVVPLKGSFYIIKGDTAEAHDEDYYMKGVGAKQVAVIDTPSGDSIMRFLNGKEKDLLSIYKAQGI